MAANLAALRIGVVKRVVAVEPAKSGSIGAIWQTGEENAVNAVMVALLTVGVAAFAVGIRNVQAKLERWDYQRHARD